MDHFTSLSLPYHVDLCNMPHLITNVIIKLIFRVYGQSLFQMEVVLDNETDSPNLSLWVGPIKQRNTVFNP